MSERHTRKTLIDPLLEEAGWSVVASKDGLDYRKYSNHALEEFPTANGPADYALVQNGEIVGIVEAKKEELSPQNVLNQAKRYALGVEQSSFDFNGYRVPFLYSTNGRQIWFEDIRRIGSRSREIKNFHTPDALQELLQKDDQGARVWLQGNHIPDDFLRPYQIKAIQKIEEALLVNRRRMLVAMATGTGKTLTTISLLYQLLKSGYAKRILFLVDRRALAAQAVSAMAAFEAEPGIKFDRAYEVYSQRFQREDLDEDVKFDPKVLPNHYLTDPDPGHAFIYVCTVQRMQINLFGKSSVFGSGDIDVDEEAEKLHIPIHAFDCIIADECHRGYTSAEESRWREVLDHFDAVKIGLTATPAAHTKAYFTDVVYRYDYEQAVREGFLVDYDSVRIHSDVRIKGIFLQEGEEVKLKDPQTGQMSLDILEDEREFDPTDIEKKITSTDSNRKIVNEFAKYAHEQEQKLGRFPKTLIFAQNDLPHTSHADQLVSMLRDEFNRGDDFVQKITGSPTVDRPLQLLRKFRNRPEPGIVVTVDMLSTGVDVPKIENIVFIRPVKSRILFEQMMGRGTRKCDEINKSNFTVFDTLGVLEYFAKASAFTIDPPEKPTRTLREIIDDIYNNKDSDYNVKVLIRRFQRIHKNVTSEGRRELAKFIPNGDIGAFAKDLPRKLKHEWTNTMNFLKNSEFIELLENYPRAKPVFIIDDVTEDTVTSEVLIRGKYKPVDYIQAFTKFVKENVATYEALGILLNRPKDFKTELLYQIRKTLETQPEQFTEKNLRKAYQHELADIISIIKHAAKNEPLLSAQERVDQAITKIKHRHQFTPEQEGWLKLIRDHLAQNLLIDERDFKVIPFSRRGSWKVADKVFEGKLKELLKEINEAMVA
ncbi:MAG: DEAD/DEAH box helicase family protein [Ignavibacteriales bacterium]|nr:DEAD/DEAH box helicase family protein [Ignavibacteriales bacterium]